MRMIPKYGITGATQTVVANMWLGPAFVGMLVGIPLLSTSDTGPTRAIIGWIFIVVLIASLLLSFCRLLSSYRAIRRHRENP